MKLGNLGNMFCQQNKSHCHDEAASQLPCSSCYFPQPAKSFDVIFFTAEEYNLFHLLSSSTHVTTPPCILYFFVSCTFLRYYFPQNHLKPRIITVSCFSNVCSIHFHFLFTSVTVRRATFTGTGYVSR